MVRPTRRHKLRSLVGRFAACALFARVPPGCGPIAQPPDAGRTDAAPPATLASLDRCRDRAARSEDLASISAVVRHINALPAPVTIPCLLASLPRPLTVVATTSVTSAQPAAGSDSPRLFILAPAITLSVVAAGDGAALLEFGQWVDPRRSLKGEVELPLTRPLTERAPFDRVRYRDGTTCGFCHRDESAEPDALGAFVSIALKPVSYSLVSVDALRAIRAGACASGADEGARCLFWRSLFDYGEVRQGAFEAQVETLFR